MPEAKEVRAKMQGSRIEPSPAAPLVFVFRTLFRNEHGMYRQLTCPMYGLRIDTIREECASPWKLKKALSLFLETGAYQYAGFGFVLSETFRDTVTDQIKTVADGGGDDIVGEVMVWIRNVQMRALQDVAISQPIQFIRAWETTDQSQWAEHYRMWSLALRVREEHDIGWVSSVVTPMWTPKVAALQLKIQDTVHDIGVAIQVEEDYHWRVCAAEDVIDGSGDSHQESLPTDFGSSPPNTEVQTGFIVAPTPCIGVTEQQGEVLPMKCEALD